MGRKKSVGAGILYKYRKICKIMYIEGENKIKKGDYNENEKGSSKDSIKKSGGSIRHSFESGGKFNILWVNLSAERA